MKFKVAFVSDIGNYRKINQDYLGYDKNKYGAFLGIVCDGMGGHAYGEIAAKFVVKKFLHFFKETDFSNLTNSEINRWLRTTIEKIVLQMKEYASTRSSTLDMGTTLTALLIANNKAFIVNVGDSRTYKFVNNNLYQVTKDQNLWNSTPHDERERSQKYKNYGAKINEMTYWKILVSALGPRKNLKIDTYLINDASGLYFLTTDGIHDYIDEESVIDILDSRKKLKKKCKNLIELAKGNLSTDNLSILMIEVN